MQQKGFTLIEMMLVVAIVGILASLAIPVYQDYLVKARITEGLTLAEVAKLAVADVTFSSRELPKGQQDTAYISPQPTENVKSITIGQNGVITIAYKPTASEGTLLLVPQITDSGEINWDCRLGTLAKKYRPMACR